MLVGGLSHCVHFKKWYKRIFLGILDFIMTNGICRWNLYASQPGSDESVLTMAQFQAGFAEELITFVDEERSITSLALQSEILLVGHCPVLLNDRKEQPFCCVCKLEENWQTKTDNRKDEQGNNSRLQKYLCKGQNSEWKLMVHNGCVDHEWKIFMLPNFENMSCFEIAHSTVCKGLFQPLHESDNHMLYSIAALHPLYLSLRRIHNLPEKRQKWGK